jgi:ABC-type multidrug transport system ATPase subunit
MALHPVVAVCDLTFAWPDGTVVFDGVSFAADAGVSGLVGTNGSGKSTLLRLIASQLTPTAGSIRTAGHLAYLP